jgi:hypothetical protein
MSPGFSVTQAALKTSLPSEEGSLQQVPSSHFTGNANMQRSANYLALEVRVLNSPPKMPCDRPCVVFKPIKVCDEGMDFHCSTSRCRCSSLLDVSGRCCLLPRYS